jgi:tetratricopeptide (TPR) repeat protein
MEECTPEDIQSLAVALINTRGDPEPLLRRGLVLHPRDYSLNLLLARTLADKARTFPPGEECRQTSMEATGYLRVCLAVRPRAAATRLLMGSLLTECGRFDEAVRELKEAAVERLSVLDATALQVRAALAHALILKGDLQEALNACDEALAVAPYRQDFQALRKEVLQRRYKR